MNGGRKISRRSAIPRHISGEIRTPAWQSSSIWPLYSTWNCGIRSHLSTSASWTRLPERQSLGRNGYRCALCHPPNTPAVASLGYRGGPRGITRRGDTQWSAQKRQGRAPSTRHLAGGSARPSRTRLRAPWRTHCHCTRSCRRRPPAPRDLISGGELSLRDSRRGRALTWASIPGACLAVTRSGGHGNAKAVFVTTAGGPSHLI